MSNPIAWPLYKDLSQGLAMVLARVLKHTNLDPQLNLAYQEQKAGEPQRARSSLLVVGARISLGSCGGRCWGCIAPAPSLPCAPKHACSQPELWANPCCLPLSSGCCSWNVGGRLQATALRFAEPQHSSLLVAVVHAPEEDGRGRARFVLPQPRPLPFHAPQGTQAAATGHRARPGLWKCAGCRFLAACYSRLGLWAGPCCLPQSPSLYRFQLAASLLPAASSPSSMAGGSCLECGLAVVY